MKKNFLLLPLLCLIFSLGNLNAQNEMPAIGHEVGVNATFFVKEFLSLNEDDPDFEPYSLYYKLLNNNAEMAFRFGLGLSIDNSTEKQNSGNQNEPERKDKASSFNLRLGAEKQFPIGKKWLAYLGGDFVYQQQSSERNIVDPFFSSTTTEFDQSLLGGGPVIGVQFKINERIRLSTETSLYYLSGTETSTIRFEEDFPTIEPIEDIETETDMENLLINLPSSVYFSIVF